MAIRGSDLSSSAGDDKLALGREGPAEESNAEIAIRFLRAGTLLIVCFQGLFLAMHAWLLGAGFTRYLLVLHLISVGCGAVGFLISYSAFVRRRWRLIGFCVSSVVVICASLITSAVGERDFLTYEMVLVLTGTGAFLPWEPGWQWAFTAVTLGAYAPAAGLHLTDLPVAVGWLTLLTSAAIGHVAVAINAWQPAADSRNVRQAGAGRLAARNRYRRAGTHPYPVGPKRHQAPASVRGQPGYGLYQQHGRRPLYRRQQGFADRR